MLCLLQKMFSLHCPSIGIHQPLLFNSRLIHLQSIINAKVFSFIDSFIDNINYFNWLAFFCDLIFGLWFVFIQIIISSVIRENTFRVLFNRQSFKAYLFDWILYLRNFSSHLCFQLSTIWMKRFIRVRIGSISCWNWSMVLSKSTWYCFLCKSLIWVYCVLGLGRKLDTSIRLNWKLNHIYIFLLRLIG